MPRYFCDHPVYYAGPAKTPDGMASGSFGPTTAGRMDSYVDLFQKHGGSKIMLAKGNRSRQASFLFVLDCFLGLLNHITKFSLAQYCVGLTTRSLL